MKTYGLLGHTLSHSISPLVHEIIMNYTGLKGSYYIFEREEAAIPRLIDDIRHDKVQGINVTIPYKQTVMPMLDILSSEANEIGAVNTVCITDGKLTGYNTDCYGFIKMLECSDINVKGKTAVVLGNGGSSKAVCYALDKLGAQKIAIVSRNPQQNGSKHDIISYTALNKLDYHILINTTPVGMYPKIDACPVSDEVIKKAEAVVDIIYRPNITQLMKKAQSHGIPAINGLYMLTAQAIQAQAIWNNIEFTNDDIKNIYQLVLGGYDFG